MSGETSPSKIRKTKGSVVRPRTKDALAKLGRDIEFARRVRGITVEQMAQMAGISRATLHRLESGEGAGVSLNTLAMIMTALGQLNLINNLIDMRNDDVGLAMLRERVGQEGAMRHRAQPAPSQAAVKRAKGRRKAAEPVAATPTEVLHAAPPSANPAILKVKTSPSSRGLKALAADPQAAGSPLEGLRQRRKSVDEGSDW